MANMASTAVTLRDNYALMSGSGQKYSVREVTLVLVAMGGATNTIPASALGMSFISGVTTFIKDDNVTQIPASPSYDGSLILLNDGALGVADATGTFRTTVTGRNLAVLS